MSSNPDKHLDEISLRALTWKPSVARDIAVDICQRVIVPPWRCWPDEIKLAGVSAEDRHIVGLAWRQLMKAKVIKQTGIYRRSNSPGRHGGTVFQYELVSRARAETFIRRNGKIPKVNELQTDLFTMPPQYPNN